MPRGVKPNTAPIPGGGRIPAKTRPKAADTRLDPPGIYICTRCGHQYKRLKENFSPSQSSLFKNNYGYLPVCKECLDELWEHYYQVMNDPLEAMRRVCMKMDIYWNPKVAKAVLKNSTNVAKMRAYNSRICLFAYNGKTFDDTLDEEAADAEAQNVLSPDATPPSIDIGDQDEIEGDETDALYRPVTMSDVVDMPTPETINFWGTGFTAAFYHELNARYARWTGQLDHELDIAEEALYKQICIQEASINRNVAAGKSIEQGQNALNTLLGSLNAKPIQKKEEDNAGDVDDTPMGVWIRRWEDKRPLPEDDEIDRCGIIKYISIWFLGHLGKMLGLKNVFVKSYDDEIAKYTVNKPEYQGEDDEETFDNIIADFSQDGTIADDANDDGGDEE